MEAKHKAIQKAMAKLTTATHKTFLKTLEQLKSLVHDKDAHAVGECSTDAQHCPLNQLTNGACLALIRTLLDSPNAPQLVRFVADDKRPKLQETALDVLNAVTGLCRPPLCVDVHWLVTDHSLMAVAAKAIGSPHAPVALSAICLIRDLVVARADYRRQFVTSNKWMWTLLRALSHERNKGHKVTMLMGLSLFAELLGRVERPKVERLPPVTDIPASLLAGMTQTLFTKISTDPEPDVVIKAVITLHRMVRRSVAVCAQVVDLDMLSHLFSLVFHLPTNQAVQRSVVSITLAAVQQHRSAVTTELVLNSLITYFGMLTGSGIMLLAVTFELLQALLDDLMELLELNRENYRVHLEPQLERVRRNCETRHKLLASMPHKDHTAHELETLTQIIKFVLAMQRLFELIDMHIKTEE